MPPLDFRSDTFTLPDEGMRRAMFEAELGDDVWGEDPTVNRLQERAAELLGKEAALFVASGTMGNQLGVLVNAQRGHAMVADSQSHVLLYEAGGAAAIGSVQLEGLPTERGMITPSQLVAALAPDDPHYAPTAAVALENTHNRHGGTVWPPDLLDELCATAHAHGLRVHLDGARIFNAAVATDVEARRLAAGVDTVTFCLSKGLGCPVGSVFCGSASDMHEARRWRKMLGGGMRQAGVLAAAGLYALDHMIDRLAEDHANARVLGEALAELPGCSCDLSRVETNMVFVDVPDAPRFVTACAQRGLLTSDTAPRTLRFVTHYGIDGADVQRAIEICAEVAREAA